jgi:hypothetical protein
MVKMTGMDGDIAMTLLVRKTTIGMATYYVMAIGIITIGL